MDLAKMAELTKAVKLLVDNGVEVMVRDDKPSIAYLPTKTFLAMFNKYDKEVVSNDALPISSSMHKLIAMHEGVQYQTYAFDWELKECEAE